jgi:hypothetical protein
MPSDSSFVLPNDSHSQFDLALEQALHFWIMKISAGKLQVSYDQMLRIRDQIQNSPENRQWKMDLGRYWEIHRNGNTLAVFRGNKNNQPSTADIPPWIIIDGNESEANIPDIQETAELNFGPLPNNMGHSSIMVVQAKECSGMYFTPSWRKGRRAIKIKDFLRGQKVPLHRRYESTVLCLSGDFSRHALAVHVEDTVEVGIGTWCVDANFLPQNDLPITTVVLGKTVKLS